jgi:hypothetical protein
MKRLANHVHFLKLNAIVILGLISNQSIAQNSFDLPTSNPFGLTNNATVSKPTFVDLDADGDFDMFMSGNSYNFYYFENIGSNAIPSFDVVLLNPFAIGGIGVSWNDPTFVDIDNDGDLDFIFASGGGGILFNENVGSTTSPNFSSTTYNANPLFGTTNIPTTNATITSVDIDNDGDYDLFASGDNGQIYFYENIGTPSGASFGPIATNPFSLDPTGFLKGSPEFVDLDADGDYDLVFGEELGRFVYFENIGTSNSPNFATPQVNPFDLTPTGANLSSPTFADIDNDGDLDLISGDIDGNFKFFKNVVPCNITDQSISVNDSEICYNSSAVITVGSSENGLEYFLRDDSDNTVISGPTIGNGSALTFNTGALVNSTTYNVVANTVPLSGVNLPNNNDKIQFNTPFSAYTNEITVEAWVNFTSTSFADFPWASQASSNVDNMASNVWLWTPGGVATFYVNDNGAWRTLNFPAIGTTGWHHVATVANSGGLFIYYDGVLVASNTNGITATIVNNPASVIELGQDVRYPSLTTRNSANAFDNFSVWNVAKTDVEIAANYQNCLVGDEIGLVQATKMNEGSGTTLYSVNGVNGSIVNPATSTWIVGSRFCDEPCTLEMSQTILVSVTPELVGTNNTTICNEESLIINGNTYDASNPTGIEVFTNIGPNGCDSTVTISLNVLPALSGSVTSTICNEESIIVNGTTYDSSNPSGTEVFTNIGPNGCDSTVTINLNVLPALTGVVNTTICNEESVIVNGNTYDSSNPSGTEVFTNIGPNGCDSTVTINLNVLPALIGNVNSTICNEESVIVNGNTYDASNPNGTEVFTNIGANGCDSTVTINLNVLPALTGVVNTTICNEESVIVNGTTYDVSNPAGTEVFTNIGVNGCDSTVTINLNVLPAIDVSTTTSNETISAILTGASYQWLDCDNANTPISGEVGQTFTATVNGSYAVQITENGCLAVSSCIDILSTSIENIVGEKLITVYPNPTTGIIHIVFPESELNTTIEITNTLGQVLNTIVPTRTELNVDLSNQPNGVYLINFNSSNGIISHKIIKN